MNRSLSLIAISLFFLLTAGCLVFEVGIEQPLAPDYALTATVSTLKIKNEELAQMAALAAQRAANTPTPESSSITSEPLPDPSFSNLRFSLLPDADLTQRFYAGGTQRVYALWDFENMQDGMVLKRVWWYNDMEWIYSEDVWSVERFGENGTMKGISVFDEESGLRPGKYSLYLYIDDTLQLNLGSTDGQTPHVFWVFEPGVTSAYTSPALNYIASVEGSGRLMIQRPGEEPVVRAVAQEISFLAWFPDNLHLLFIERDRTNQQNEREDHGITHKLWVLAADSGERRLIGTAGENLHSPVISPNGHYIALLSGETIQQGCTSSPELMIMELDPDLRRQALYPVADFNNLPFSGTHAQRIYPNLRVAPMRWEAENRLVVSLWWSCLYTNEPIDGEYALDLTSMTATLIR
jgi:hypothetical protein